ncbi:MAG: hypothetical protein A3K59_06275 [Euryarchaeota archaeon RBG_19FT_COMBO_69_17]|nr:MAG: hypothetical protein A3K59_06275 [Euryarchaeota archaeon RBG_19FT_COMBO_69_17]
MFLTLRTIVLLLSLSLATGGAAFTVFSAFDPAPFEGDPGTDYGLDTDGDGAYDWLVVEADVTLPDAGNWDISASLLSSTPPATGDCLGPYPIPVRYETIWPEYVLASAYERYFFPAGAQTVRFAFLGTDIHRSGVDGPYLVRAVLYNGDVPRFLDPGLIMPEPYPWPSGVTWNATTQAYRATDFEELVRPVRFTGTYADVPVHVDDDGLYDLLEIRADVVVTTPGLFSVNGDLHTAPTDPNQGWWSVAWAYDDVRLDTRDTSVVLRFRGDQIRMGGQDGPWGFSLTIYGMNDWYNGTGVVDPGLSYPYPYYPETLCGRTAPYAASDYDDTMEIARYTGAFEEATDDWDADGRYDALRVRAEVEVYLSSGFDLVGTLRSGDGRTEITGFQTTTWWSDGLTWAEFSFYGPDIQARGLDGPYEAVLSITPSVARIAPLTTYRTAAYLATDFDEGLPGGGNRTHWIADLQARVAPDGSATATVLVQRGDDPLTYVIEDTIALALFDSLGGLLWTYQDRVYLPSGGSTWSVSSSMGVLTPGLYSLMATLGADRASSVTISFAV